MLIKVVVDLNVGEWAGPYDIVFPLDFACLPSTPSLTMLLRPPPRTRLLPLLTSLLFVTACSSVPEATSFISPYRIDVRQGNYVTQEMIARLKPGMSRDQVRFALGTPLVTDIFHADRWDYVYRFQPGRGEVQLRRLVVFFEDGKLARVGGDVVAETPATAAEAPAPTARVIEVPGTAKKD
jgi:outer membrane protein assembly factor BamE